MPSWQDGRRDPMIINRYADINFHQRMVADDVRTVAYRDAIAATVRPDDCVLDLGCGVGILSFFAAQAGARQVYAVERTPIIRVAQQVAKDNGFDNIEFLHADALAVEVPEPIDVIVFEGFGNFVFSDDMLAPLIRVRDSYLADGGRIVPQRCLLRAALVTDRAVHDDLEYWRRQQHGIDFSFLGDWPFHESRRQLLRPSQLSDKVIELGDIDLRTVEVAPQSGRGSVRCDEPMTAHGICAWFELELGNSVTIDTGPSAPATHWQQHLFPLAEPMTVPADSSVDIAIECDAALGGWRWVISCGEQSQSMEDYLHRMWLHRK